MPDLWRFVRDWAGCKLQLFFWFVVADITLCIYCVYIYMCVYKYIHLNGSALNSLLLLVTLAQWFPSPCLDAKSCVHISMHDFLDSAQARHT